MGGLNQVNGLLKLKGKLSPEAYEQVVQKYREACNKTTNTTPHRKRNKLNSICEAILEGQEVPRITGCVSVSFHTVRKFIPLDPGAISHKAALDSVVSCGVLQNDTLKSIPQVPRVTVSRGDVEYTEIVIEKIK